MCVPSIKPSSSRRLSGSKSLSSPQIAGGGGGRFLLTLSNQLPFSLHKVQRGSEQVSLWEIWYHCAHTLAKADPRA